MKQRGLLGLVTFSEKRSKILLSLLEGRKTFRELKDLLETTSQQMIPQIRKLEDNNLVCQEGEKYRLTEVGEIITGSFDQFSKIAEMFEGNSEFWKEHDISGVPEEFHSRIHELGDYEIIKGNSVEVFKPHKEFMQNLEGSEWVRGVSPIFHSNYPKSFLEMAKSGVDLKLVLTQNVFEKIKSDNRRELESLLECENAEMLICDRDVKIAFTVTDRFLSLGLFGKGGHYDTNCDLVSKENSAVKFGRDLFKYYEEQSKEVEL